MNIAIIGAGLAGLSTAHFLTTCAPDTKVTLFDQKGVGKGASGVCSGLLHPYPGLNARRSFRSTEAIKASKELLRIAEAHTPRLVARQNGIYRQVHTSEQMQMLNSHANEWGDVQRIGPMLFEIHSGITVYTTNYLAGLFAALELRGVELVARTISSLEELNRYDHVVVAAGWGIRTFRECASVRVRFIKGQALRLQGKPPHAKSCISKGYLAHFGEEEIFDVGATYEREFETDLPDQCVAEKLLAHKLEGEGKGAKILFCKAGIRVASAENYLPVAKVLSDRLSVFTGLGSRGLLYHALYGRALAQAILSKKPSTL